MIGSASAFASIMREVNMRKRDTFMHPPHGDWLICMALTITHCAYHGMTFETALEHALDSPPKHGWDTERKLMVELMIKHFLREPRDELS